MAGSRQGSLASVVGVVIDSKNFYYLGAIVGTIEVATGSDPLLLALARISSV